MPILGSETYVPNETQPLDNTTLEAPISLVATFSTSTLISDTFGKDAPLMERISLCESGDRQFMDGKPLMSKTRDFGYYQINEAANGKEAERLGLDYKNSFIDNLKMAKGVLDSQGITAWSCSSKL